MQARNLSLIFLFTLIVVFQVSAAEMESPNYRLDSGTVEFFTEEPVVEQRSQQEDPAEVKTLLTVQEQAQFNSQGYVFLDTSRFSANQLSAQFSSSLIEFSELSTNNSQKKDLTIHINKSPDLSANISVAQETVFTSPNGTIIPATRCQYGEVICTHKQAQKWEDQTIFGFGYSLNSPYKPIDFIDDSYYRSLTNGVVPHKIVTHKNNSPKSDSTISFKINIPVDQTESSYKTDVLLFVLPQL